MRLSTHIRNNPYNRKPMNSTWNVPSFFRVTEKDTAGLLNSYRMNTPRVKMTTLRTWSSNTSYLMNIRTENQGKTLHQNTESCLLKISQREIMIYNNDNCQKSATCHKCGNKGCIRPNRPNKKSDDDGDYPITNSNKKKVSGK